MKSFNSFYSAAGFLFLLMLSLFGCNEKEADYESFLIEVDSMNLPEEITVGQPFNISFSGTIGNNGCYRFSHFETEKEDHEILVEAWGEVNVSSDVCAEVMVYLDEELSYQIDEKGSYTIRVKLPGGGYLEEQFSVE